MPPWSWSLRLGWRSRESSDCFTHMKMAWKSGWHSTGACIFWSQRGMVLLCQLCGARCKEEEGCCLLMVIELRIWLVFKGKRFFLSSKTAKEEWSALHQCLHFKAKPSRLPASALALSSLPQPPRHALLCPGSWSSRFGWRSKQSSLSEHASGKEEWLALHQRLPLKAKPSGPISASALPSRPQPLRLASSPPWSWSLRFCWSSKESLLFGHENGIKKE